MQLMNDIFQPLHFSFLDILTRVGKTCVISEKKLTLIYEKKHVIYVNTVTFQLTIKWNKLKRIINVVR